MEFLVTLWMPILISGIAVFFLSALAWVVLPHHRTEYRPLTNGDAVAAALRAGSATHGQYMYPHSAGADMNSPEFKAKLAQGPVAFITIAPAGDRGMGPMMAQSLAFNIVVSVFIAYVAALALPAGAEYLKVFQVTGTLAFMAYALGTVPDAIWFARPWKAIAMQWVDAIVFACVVGGIFGWRWPG